MELELARDRTTQALAIHRKRLPLREVNWHLKVHYEAGRATPFSSSLCDLLEKLERMSDESGNGVPS
jgi:hypothetical protein